MVKIFTLRKLRLCTYTWSRPEIYFEATQQVERLKKLQGSAEAELEKKQLEKQNVSFRRIGESGFHREICILSGKLLPNWVIIYHLPLTRNNYCLKDLEAFCILRNLGTDLADAGDGIFPSQIFLR